MSLYNIIGHPMLSDAALQLGETELEAHAIAAEFVLKLTDFAAPSDTTSDNYHRGQAAVAMQVSYQVECGIEAFILTSFSRGTRSTIFRRGGHNMSPTHPLARRIASKLRTAALG